MLKLNKVGFKYESSPDLIFKDISIQFSKGWTGIIGANGSGKTTLLMLASNSLKPSEGNVKSIGSSYYCEQRTDNKPHLYEGFINSYENYSFQIQELLKINTDLFSRWETLSHGERKKCQLATALFHNPDILIIDEPTNHIDSNTKEAIIRSLKNYKGIGLIVSHDRFLLNQLCSSIVFIESQGCRIINGNYDTYEEERKKEFKYISNTKENLNKAMHKLNKEILARGNKVSQSNKRSSKRNVSRKDHDAKSKIDAARLTGKDGIESKKYAQLKNRLERIKKKKDLLNSTAKRELGVEFESTKSSKEIILFKKADRIALGEKKLIIHPDLYIKRNDKVGLIGDNGCGKSTLINRLVKEIHSDYFAYIPQEISSRESQKLLKDSLSLTHEEKGKIFTIISRLNSDPKQLMESIIPSPGEVRKLMLANAILKENNFIVMDEPTNHMDLPSINCVEETLVDFRGALLLVSHDQTFLNRIINKTWNITELDYSQLQLKII